MGDWGWLEATHPHTEAETRIPIQIGGVLHIQVAQIISHTQGKKILWFNQ